MITFQLTDEGFRRLSSSGIAPGDRFGRALLLDLYRTGDAFTYGSGVEPGESKLAEQQMTLDFADDPLSEHTFPACASCSSMSDLHLVEIKKEKHYASITCCDCRVKKSADIDSSIPLPLVSRTLLGGFLRMKDIQSVDASVEAYRQVLNAEFSEKWEALLKAKSAKQGRLLDPDDDK